MEKSMKGLLKGSHKGLMTGAIFVLAIALVLGVLYVTTVSASHSTATTVAPAGPVDTSQAIQLNFTITRTGADNFTRININFTAAGWGVPSSNNSITCSNSGSTQWNASLPGGGIVRCFADVADINFTGTTFNITVSGTASPAAPQTSTFTINTTDDTGITNVSTVAITVTQLFANATLNDTVAEISSAKAYTFTIGNNGTDEINRIIITYTNAAFADPSAGNIVCPSISGSWGSASVDADLNTITCTNSGGQNLVSGQSTTITVGSFTAPATAGVKTFDIDARGNLGGNFSLQANRPTVTVYGTMALTSVDRASGATTVAIGAANKIMGQINLSSTGEAISSIAIRVNTVATNLNDLSRIMVYNDTGCNGTIDASNDFIQVSDTVNQSMVLTLASTGNIPSGKAQCYLIAYNISATATGGDTIKISVGGTNTTGTGDSSSQTITSTGSAFGSSTVTIFGALNISGTNRVATTKQIGTSNVLVITYNFTATSEDMNVTNIQLTRTGTSQDADVTAVALYNETNINDGVLNGTETLIGWKTASPNGVYNFTNMNFIVKSGATNYQTLLIILNLSSSATAGRTFGVELTPTNVSTTSITSAQAITETVTTGASTASKIYGTSAIIGINQNPATTVIASNNVVTIIYNITATGEQMNLTAINITRLGSMAGSTNTNISSIGLYNNSVGDTALGNATLMRWNATEPVNGVYVFNISADDSTDILNISSGGSQLLFVVFNITPDATGGQTFGANIATANLSMLGSASGVVITPTLTSSNSSLSTIYGNFSVVVADLTPTNVDQSQEAGIISLAFKALGEAMNIKELNATMVNTNNNDVTAAKLYEDTDTSSSYTSGDTLITTAALSGNVARFGSGATNGIYNVSRGLTKTLIITYVINASATASNTVDAQVVGAGNITVTGALSGVAITTIGAFALNPAGTSNILALSATAVVNDTTQQINLRKNLKFTITNPSGGDSINEIRVNYSISGYADTETANLTCPTIGAGAWDKTIDSNGKVVKCTKTSIASALAAGANADVSIASFLAPATAGSKVFDITVNGSAGGNFTLSSSRPTMTVYGTLSLTGTNRVASTRQIGTTNVTIITYNLTAAGEAMNVSAIQLTRTGSVQDADISAVGLYNDTSNEGVYNATETLIGWNTTSNGVYTFSNINLIVPSAGSQILLIVFNLSSSATGGRTFGVEVIAANVTTTGVSSSQSITETVTTGASTASTIFGTSAITGINRLTPTVNVSSTNVPVIIYNITATGEQMNLTAINITQLGTSAGPTNTNITAVGLYNNSAGTDLATATLMKWNATRPTNGVYVFNISADDGTSILNVSAGGTQYLFVVFNISGTADVTFGKTVGANIATANLSMLGSASGVAITPTLTSSNSSLATIVGTSSITGINKAGASNNVSTSNVAIIVYNITATGEAMTLSNLNITRLGTATAADIAAVGVYNNSVTTSATDSTLIGWNSSSPTGLIYNFSATSLAAVAAGSNQHIIVVFNLSSSATGGRTFGANIATVNLTLTGATSSQAITPTLASSNSSTPTIFGTTSLTGINQVTATTNISSTNAAVMVYNITATGEAMNITEFNITMTGTATAADIPVIALYNSSTSTSITGATAVSTNGTRTGINVRFAGTPAVAVAAGGYQHLIVVVNVAAGATAGNTFGVNTATANMTFRGGTSNIEAVPVVSTTASSTSTIIGTSTITGINQVSGTTNASSSNVAIVVFNLTATGEAMNLSEINITMLGSALAADVTTVALYNSSTGTSITGATAISANGTRSGIMVNFTKTAEAPLVAVAAGGYQHLIVAFNVASAATGGRTFGAASTTANMTVISGTTGQNIKPSTQAALTSTTSTIYGTSAITGIDKQVTMNPAGTNNIAVVVYNITAMGEAVNLSYLNITRLGTATAADIAAVGVYNNSVTTSATGSTLIGWNSSSPSGLVYSFSGTPIVTVAAGSNQHIIVVFNLSSSAIGGRTFGANIATANLTMVGGTTNNAIVPTVTSTASSTSTISTLNITGINKLGATTDIGATNVVVMVYNITSSSEQMNLTAINITRTGTAVDGDIVAVGLYNNTADTVLANSTLLRWNTSSPVNGVYNFTGASLLNISSNSFQHLLVVFNISSSATGGRTFGISLGSTNMSITSGTSGYSVTPQTLTSAGSNISTIAGTLTITGTTRVAATTAIETKNITVVTFNISATSEQMNISEILITRTGNINDGDIASVSLYNDTINDGVFNGTETLLSIKTTSSSGKYNFSGLSLAIPSGGSRILLVVVNTTATAAGGHTFGMGINVSADVATIGGSSGQTVAESITTGLSDNSTLYGNLTITGTNKISQYMAAGAVNVSVISYSFTAFGETMNINNFSLTRTGTAGDGDILAVGLFNATNDDGVLNATETLVRWNLTMSGSVYNFSAAPLFTVTNGTTQVLIVVANVSSGAVGGRTFGLTTSTANMTVVGASSSVAITPTVATLGSNTSTTTADSSAPTITATAPTTAAKVTTATPALLVNTSENAVCKFDTSSKVYASMANIMDGSGTTHNYTLASLTNGVYTYYVRCQDTYGNVMTTSEPINFEVNATDTAAPVITATAPTTAATVTTSTPALLVNTSETATCKFDTSDTTYASMSSTFTGSGSTAHNYTLSSQNDGVKAYYARCQDTAGNVMTSSSVIWFSIDTTGNYNYTQPTTGYFSTGWKTLFIPTQTIMESTGKTSAATGSFNFTSILSSMGSNWNYMYYNVNGSSSGWVLATRTDPGGSTLKYVNNTNDKPYYINVTASNVRFTL
ncbi:hypothetical protein HYZ41_00310 [archaeon]|nr:hypothetical protein [archaeon]